VDWLARAGLLAREQAIDEALRGEYDHSGDGSLRTLQRRFLRATGLTQSAARQIERASPRCCCARAPRFLMSRWRRATSIRRT
jgi:hypothetical protein